jgi:hypothetical protein
MPHTFRRSSTRLLMALIATLAALPAAAANLRLDNDSLLPISLEIPGVMSARLWPKSQSFVTLEKGQKVYFQYRGERELLIEITDQKDGDVLGVDDLIDARKDELDAARQR